MALKNKNVLITAGPTWVPLDSVRVISNTASGQTGELLADRLAKLGAKVTLVLGPVTGGLNSKKMEPHGFTAVVPEDTRRRFASAGPPSTDYSDIRRSARSPHSSTGLHPWSSLPAGQADARRRIKVIPFRFFDDLKKIISRQLKTGKYHVLIHSAAVSDYKPVKIFSAKVNSGLKNWKICLKPTAKIIDLVKKIAPGILLVGFKFAPDTNKAGLIKSTKALMLRSGLDLAVANTLIGGRYRAYILSGDKISPVLTSKEELAAQLANKIRKMLCIR
jgi:phosphopantothenoylcysteine synthetase/decarboxylase